MEKQQLITELTKMVQEGVLTKQEILPIFEGVIDSEKTTHHFSISNVLYYIGGGIVFLGIFILCVQNWSYFNSVLRICITLGSTLLLFGVAVVLFKNEATQKMSQAFFFISSLLAPVSFYVLLYEIGIEVSTRGVQSLLFAILMCLWFASFWVYRQTILLFFTIVFASAFFYMGVGYGAQTLSLYEQSLVQYTILALGLSYLSLGYFLKTIGRGVLTGVLYSFGSLGFLGAALWLGGYSPDQNLFWEFIYPVLVFGIIFLSVRFKSKALLTFGSLFLVGYIAKITGEYFSVGLGWPLALVLAGLLVMFVGFYAVRINKEYLTKIKPL